MAKRKRENKEYQALKQDLREKHPKRLYAFWGEERYLLEHYLKELRKIIPAESEEFNHRRLDGRNMALNDLQEAIDALPVFSEMTLTEVNDFDFSKMGEQTRGELLHVLSDIPEYACVVFIFDTVEFKLDGRVKANSALKKLFTSVEFAQQDQDELVNWIARHFKAEGKKIDRTAAEHLAFVTGGMMTNLSNEIGKLSAYCRGDKVTVRDIDAVVTPVLDAAAYELTDAILSGDGDKSVSKLGELMMMNEPPHKILFSIAAKLRQLLAAKTCLLSGKNMDDFMELCSVRYEFQARGIFTSARQLSLDQCRDMVLMASDTAYRFNSSQQDPGELLQELVMKLAICTGRKHTV